MKLTRKDTKLHEEALEILKKDVLNESEKIFVLENYHPGASFNVGKNGVFFTPMQMAADAAMFHGSGGRVLDACAGIGALAFHKACCNEPIDITCIEMNPEYVKVGKKIVPEAKWICGDIFDILPTLPKFDSAISNPPFGNVGDFNKSKNFKNVAHFAIIELLIKYTRYGAIVIIPETDHSQEDKRNEKGLTEVSKNFTKFKNLYPNANISPGPFDVSFYRNGWRSANPKCQICDLTIDG